MARPVGLGRPGGGAVEDELAARHGGRASRAGQIPWGHLPAGGHARPTRELLPLGGLQGHLAVVGLGDVGVRVRRAGAEIGDRRIDQVLDWGTGGEAPGVVGAELVAALVRDRSGDGDRVDAVRVEVRARVEGRGVARVADRGRDVRSGSLLAKADARPVDRRRVHRLAELDLHVAAWVDTGGVGRRGSAADSRCGRVRAGRVSDRNIAQHRRPGRVSAVQLGAVLDVAGVARDVVTARGDRGEGAPGAVGRRGVAGADAERDPGAGRCGGVPGERTPVGCLTRVEDA